MIDKISTKHHFQIILLCMCYLVAHLITSCHTSPLCPDYHGGDSALFALVGKGITEGKIMYKDLFDHKGPFIFFFNALGCFLGGRTGIFMLQGIAGLVSLVFLYKTVRLLRSDEDFSSIWNVLFLFACGFIVCFRTFEGGNLTEEYSQPFISCALYLFVRYAVKADACPEHSPGHAFIYGICLAFLALFRLNNAVSVCAGILTLFIYLIYKKQYKNLILNLMFGILGICVVILPVCGYFWYHSALDEMVFAAFLYNFKIFGGPSHYSLLTAPLAYFSLYCPLVISFILLIAKVRKYRSVDFVDILLAVILICNTANLWLANRYVHYFALFAPIYVVFLWRYLTVDFKKIATYLVIFCTLCNFGYLVNYSGRGYYSNYISLSSPHRDEAVKQCTSLIPESERNSVIGYEIPVAYYIHGDIMPCYKYYTWQENWGNVHPEVLTDFMDFLKTDKPLWVLTMPEEDNPVLLEILSENYQLQCENKELAAYRLKEE